MKPVSSWEMVSVESSSDTYASCNTFNSMGDDLDVGGGSVYVNPLGMTKAASHLSLRKPTYLEGLAARLEDSSQSSADSMESVLTNRHAKVAIKAPYITKGSSRVADEKARLLGYPTPEPPPKKKSILKKGEPREESERLLAPGDPGGIVPLVTSMATAIMAASDSHCQACPLRQGHSPSTVLCVCPPRLNSVSPRDAMHAS